MVARREKEKEKERENEKASPEIKSSSSFDFRILLAGLIIFLVAMGSTYFLMKSVMAPLMPQKEKEVKVMATGDLVSVGEFTTNVNDVAGTRYLKVEVFVQVSDKKVKDSIDQYMPIIKDSILTILSSQTVADLDVHNRNNLKAEIKKDLNSKIGANVINNVYFTNFIMQ
jgi:flagellar FliL protein